MQIIVAPDPRLLQKAELVELEELPKLKAKAAEMAELMYETQGCGLAAPQVGLSKRLIVVDPEWGIIHEEGGEPTPQNPRVLVNPVILRLWGEMELLDEGCLSVPGLVVPIERFESVQVEAFDLDGNRQLIEAEGFPARVLQHEIDHLEGMTLFERLDPIKRIDAIQQYRAAIAAGAKPGDTSVASRAEEAPEGTGPAASKQNSGRLAGGRQG